VAGSIRGSLYVEKAAFHPHDDLVALEEPDILRQVCSPV
jgi:hypothetical protein